MPRRILHVLPSFDLGGLGSLGLAMIKGWNPEDRHLVVAPRYSQTIPTLFPLYNELSNVVDTLEVPRNFMDPMQYANALRETFKSLGQIDAVLLYNFSDHVWTIKALRAVYTGDVFCHVGTIVPKREDIGLMLKSPLTQRDNTFKGVRFISPSKAVRAGLLEAGAPLESIGPVIWNGVDLEAYCPPVEPAQPSYKEITLGFVGRMAPEAKDFPLLIQAMGYLSPDAKKQCVLRLVGAGPLEPKLKELAYATNVRIEFLGPKPPNEIPHFLRETQIFVMAALPIEGMSIALVEAMASGCAIVATDVPANREVVTKTEAGRLSPRDPKKLAQILESLILDRSLIRTLREQSRKAIPMLDVKKMVTEYQKWVR